MDEHNQKPELYDLLPLTLQGLPLKRRRFLKTSALAGLGALSGTFWAMPANAGEGKKDDRKFIAEAAYYEKLQHKQVRCKLCPRHCVIDDRERGYCGVRENRNGTYYTLVYSRPCTYHVDPIEKKPLFHFLPATLAFSIATAGCNLNCKFCQNWQISQVTPEQVPSIYLPPDGVAEAAKKYHCPSIAYTYNEPTIFFEYMRDTARAGHEQGVKSVVISAAYIEQEPIRELAEEVDAIKVDLKAFSDTYYKDIVRGELKPVLDALVSIKKSGVWNEIVYLVVPTLNDSDQEIKGLVKWINQNLGPDVPIHFTRFYPQYLLKNLPPTPVSTLERCKAIADAEGLHYVYIGNVPGHPAESTYCPHCGKKIITRNGFVVSDIFIVNGRCKFCGTPIPGVWKE